MIAPAAAPRSAKDIRVLVVDKTGLRVVASDQIASLFTPGDLVIVNDAATLPASLRVSKDLELRLVTNLDDQTWTVALLGAGDYRTKTEDRPAPPPLRAGQELQIGEYLTANVLSVRGRLADIRFNLEGSDLWAALYKLGRPVQYAHVPKPLALWDIQNVYASRPWAVEMPSAGRAITAKTLLDLQARGVELAKVTHAAGLSSIGDAAVDAILPLPERFEVTEETWEAIARTKARKGRVIAIGTSTARALEGGARAGGVRTGITDLRIGRGTRRAIVDAVLTGVHDADTSHYSLLGAFADEATLALALERAKSEGMLGHEMGDACLVWAA